jgi:hypothetical protein
VPVPIFTQLKTQGLSVIIFLTNKGDYGIIRELGSILVSSQAKSEKSSLLSVEEDNAVFLEETKL